MGISNDIKGAYTGTDPRRFLVVDTGAYNRSTWLNNCGEVIYTTSGIMKEIERYQNAHPMETSLKVFSLPIIREPTEDDIAFVKNFALKTGDLMNLSGNDICCIALTYRLQLESGDHIRIRTSPATLKFNRKAEKGNFSTNFDCWIGPDNLHSYNIKSSKMADYTVACMTTDFAMQNVLLQMGLHVITLDGFAIRSIRNWGQLCRFVYLA